MVNMRSWDLAWSWVLSYTICQTYTHYYKPHEVGRQAANNWWIVMLTKVPGSRKEWIQTRLGILGSSNPCHYQSIVELVLSSYTLGDCACDRQVQYKQHLTAFLSLLKGYIKSM